MTTTIKDKQIYLLSLRKQLETLTDDYQTDRDKIVQEQIRVVAELNLAVYKVQPGTVVTYQGKLYRVAAVEKDFSTARKPRLDVCRQTKSGWHKTPARLFCWDEEWEVVE